METMNKRETVSTFNLNGREFEINSYDPMEGNYILAQILAFVLPFGIGDMLSSSVGTEKQNVIPTSGKMMSKQDFMSLQIDILKTVKEVYSTGEKSPVVRENGTYGVAGVSMMMVLKLIVASLAFNFKDFFKEVPSKDTIMDQLGLKFANTQT